MTRKTTARSGRLPAEEAAQIPDRLLDAATALFTSTGYGKTTMEAIAKQAGASSKTVYSRFANKEEILAAAFEASAFHYPALCASTPTG